MKYAVSYMTFTIAVLGLSMIMVQAQVNKRPAGAELNAADQAFVTAAGQGGIAEVELGKLAEDKASNSSVKEFGKTMVADHSKVNDELKQTATKIGVNLPNDLSSKDKEEKAKLSKLSGAAFDKAYMSDMVVDHRADIAAFRREARRAGNENLKIFASNTLPKLRMHLRRAERTNSKIKSEKAS